MGCSHLNELNRSSSLSLSLSSSSSSSSNPNTSLPQSTSLLALCNYQANGTDQQSRTEFMGSSRWNPTPEQLLALEGMYRQGTRTPSAEQIQHIATQLRRFGKIEGKNVFYWFQNHKARERQKRRRCEIETMNPEEKQHIHPGNTSPAYKKESGLRKTGYDVEQTKNWTPPSNCSKHTEESISMHRVVVASESGIGPHGRSPFDEKELHQRKSTVDDIPSKLMDTISTTSSAYLENFNRETKTLELFPLCRDDDGNKVKATTTSKKETETINSHFTPSQFIEFLPLKN